MSERALRGTRLVVTSYETDRGIDLAPRQAVEYACQNGHRFEMPFSVEAEIPPEWECKACGAMALLVDGDGPEEKKGKPARTHWDMLMERRTREELEEVLAERLAVLRSGAMNIAVHPRLFVPAAGAAWPDARGHEPAGIGRTWNQGVTRNVRESGAAGGPRRGGDPPGCRPRG